MPPDRAERSSRTFVNYASPTRALCVSRRARCVGLGTCASPAAGPLRRSAPMPEPLPSAPLGHQSSEFPGAVALHSPCPATPGAPGRLDTACPRDSAPTPQATPSPPTGQLRPCGSARVPRVPSRALGADSTPNTDRWWQGAFAVRSDATARRPCCGRWRRSGNPDLYLPVPQNRWHGPRFGVQHDSLCQHRLSARKSPKGHQKVTRWTTNPVLLSQATPAQDNVTR